MKEITIYKITNSCNEKVYIGQTTRQLKIRLYDHISKANKGLKRKFHIAISELGKEKFEITEIAKLYDKKTADLLELELIKEYDSIKNGYNTYFQAGGSSNRGSSNGMSSG